MLWQLDVLRTAFISSSIFFVHWGMLQAEIFTTAFISFSFRIKGQGLWWLGILETYLSPLLSSLYIWECPKLTSMQVSSLPCLKTLQLHKVREEVIQQLRLVTTSSLESLYIDIIDDMGSLPYELLQHVSTLKCLSIHECSGLAVLPHEMGNLTSVTCQFLMLCTKIIILLRVLDSNSWP